MVGAELGEVEAWACSANSELSSATTFSDLVGKEARMLRVSGPDGVGIMTCG